MLRAYSIDIRQRVINKIRAGKNIDEVRSELNVSRTFVYDMIALERETGNITPRKSVPGPKPSLDENNLEAIRKLIEQTPDMTLEEIKEALSLKVAVSTLCDAINYKIKLPYKKNASRQRAKAN